MAEAQPTGSDLATRGEENVAAAGAAVDKAADKAGEFVESIGDKLKNLTPGTGIGVLAMAGIGWLLGTMFSGTGGILSTVISGLFAVGAGLGLGPKFGETIDGWLSGDRRTPSRGYSASGQAPAADRAPQQSLNASAEAFQRWVQEQAGSPGGAPLGRPPRDRGGRDR